MDHADAIMALGDDFASLVNRAQRNELTDSEIIKELRYQIEQLEETGLD